MTNTSGVQLLYPNDEFDSLVAFYDEWTEGQPEDYARSTVGDDDVVYQRMELPIVQITVTRDYEERDDVFTLLVIATGSDE